MITLTESFLAKLKEINFEADCRDGLILTDNTTGYFYHVDHPEQAEQWLEGFTLGWDAGVEHANEDNL